MISRRTLIALPLIAITAKASSVAKIISPVPNRVFQRNSSGLGAFRVSWSGAADTVNIKSGATLVSTSGSGVFSGVPSGWYDVELVSSGIVVDTMKIGVGDVYVIAGQSNSVSQRQPSSLVMPTIAEGKCILSDYYRFGSHVFRDVGVDPLNDPDGLQNAGCAWQYMIAALNRPYPVMCVLVGKGNTTIYDWAYVHLLDLFDALAIYKPRAVLWHQGESECTTPPRTDSAALLEAIYASCRSWNMTPWVMARNSTSYPPPPGYSNWPVRDAQYAVIHKWPLVHMGPDTDVMRVAGQVEYMGNSIKQMGESWPPVLTALGL